VVIRLVSVTIRSVFFVPVRFRVDRLVFFARFISSSLPFVPVFLAWLDISLDTAPEARGCTAAQRVTLIQVHCGTRFH
jgi:hypothetical protein